MDFCEKFYSMQFSLQTICAVNITQQILQSIGLQQRNDRFRSVPYNVWKSIELQTLAKALQNLKRLHLSPPANEMIEGLIKPVYDELNNWYNHHTYKFRIRPMWTQYGTVDMARSTKAVAEDPQFPNIYRYMVACQFCHEKQIVETIQLLTNRQTYYIAVSNLEDIYSSTVSMDSWESDLPCQNGHNIPFLRCTDVSSDYCTVGNLWTPLAKFWLTVYRRNGLELGCGFHLPLEVCEEGFAIALDCHLDVATRYFFSKAKAEGFPCLINRYGFSQVLSLQYGNHQLSLTTRCMLFLDLKERNPGTLDANDWKQGFQTLATSLLRNMMKWPYQPLLVDIADSLSDHVDGLTVNEVLRAIVKRAKLGYKDFNYRELFIGFWETASRHPRSRNHTIVHVLRTEDKQWIDFVFSQISALEKTELLKTSYIYSLKPQRLEMLFRVFAANDVELLVTFRNENHLYELGICNRIFSYFESEEVNQKQVVSKILGEIIAQRLAASRSEMSRSDEPNAV